MRNDGGTAGGAAGSTAGVAARGTVSFGAAGSCGISLGKRIGEFVGSGDGASAADARLLGLTSGIWIEKENSAPPCAICHGERHVMLPPSCSI